MTYSPGGPGYPPAQQHGPYAPTTQFAKVDDGPSRLPGYLLAAVAVLGVAAYLSSFGPMFTISNSEFPQLGGASGTSIGLGLAIIASLLAALLAGVGLVPKQKNYVPVVAVISVLALLLVIAEIIKKPGGVSIDWALYLVIAFTALQALAAVAVLLLEAGVITAPAPRPKYDQYQPYGAPGQYYGQPGQHPGQPHQPAAQPQQNFGGRPGYSQYGGYPSGPSAGGFGTTGPQAGPPTPPTGFPTYGQPPAPAAAPTQVTPQQQQDPSSAQPGPAPS